MKYEKKGKIFPESSYTTTSSYSSSLENKKKYPRSSSSSSVSPRKVRRSYSESFENSPASFPKRSSHANFQRKPYLKKSKSVSSSSTSSNSTYHSEDSFKESFQRKRKIFQNPSPVHLKRTLQTPPPQLIRHHANKRKNPFHFLQQRHQTNISLKEALQKIKPLDIIAFKGSEFVSDLIAKMQKKVLNPDLEKMYSHVGIVVTREILNDPLLEPGKLYIWEATIAGKLGQNVYSLHHPDSEFLGTLIRPLEELLLNYNKNNNAYYAWCPLTTYPVFSKLFQMKFTRLFQRYNDRKYDANPVSLFAALFKVCRPCRNSLEKKLGTENWMFCSELIAQVFQDLEMIPSTVVPNNVVPMDLLGFDNEYGDQNVPFNLIRDIIAIF